MTGLLWWISIYYLRGKIMWTSLTHTEIWPISDRFIKQKILLDHCALPYSVHFQKNRLGQTVQTGQQTLGHLELFSDYVRGPTPNWIPESFHKTLRYYGNWSITNILFLFLNCWDIIVLIWWILTNCIHIFSDYDKSLILYWMTLVPSFFL